MKKAALGLISSCLFSFASLAQFEDTNPVLNACMNELCAGEEFVSAQHPFEQSTTNDLRAASEAEIESKLGKPLKKWLGALISRSVYLDALVKAELPVATMNLSPETKALVHLMEILNSYTDYVEAMSNEGGVVNVNVEKLQKLKPELNIEEAELIRDVYSKYVPSGAVPLEPYLKYFHPKLSYQDALKFEANALADFMAYFQKNIPFGVLMFDYYDLIEKLDLGTISDSDSQQLTTAISTRILITNTLINEEFKARLQVYELDAKKYEAAYSEYTQSSYYKLLRENKKGIKDDFKFLYSSCKAGLVRKFADTPTQEELDAFKLKFETVKNLSIKFLNENYTDLPQDKIKSILDLKVTVPKTKVNVISNWLETITSHQKQLKDQIKVFKELAKDAEQGNLVSLLTITMSQRDLFQQVQEFCEANEDAGLSDYTSPGFGSITPSNRSIRAGNYGTAVLLHELGHQVSYYMGSKLDEVKSCQAVKANNQNLTQEEDFADLFSASILKANPSLVENKKINLGCGLSKKFGDDWYQLKLGPSEDSHSTYLYRTLTFAATYSNIPNSCKEYLKSENKPELSNRCEIKEASNN